MVRGVGKLPATRRATLGMMLAALGGSARTQTVEGAYPNRPVQIILPAAPGGPTDVMARVISPGLHARFGQPVLILNRAGAGGNIGVRQVAKSPADGYTLLVASTGFVVNPSLYRDPGYDPFKDFLPITELGSSPNVILVPPSSPITSIRQLIDKARADKEKLDIINPGQGSTPHLTAELLQAKAGIPVENIPYNGAGPAIQALLARTTPVGITALPPAHPHIKSGALRALAITGEKRWFDLPAVPTTRKPATRVWCPRRSRECSPRPARPRRSSSGWRGIRSRFWPNPRLSRSCVASDSTCAPAARPACQSESPAKCRCGATSSSSRA